MYLVDDDVLEDVEHFTVDVVTTGGQERVDVGDAADIFISNDDCEEIFLTNSPNVLPHTSLLCGDLTCMLVIVATFPAYWSICLCIFSHCTSVCLSFCLSVCLPALSVCLPISLFVCLSLCVSFSLSVCLTVCLSLCLLTCLSLCLSVCLLVYLFALTLVACSSQTAVNVSLSSATYLVSEDDRDANVSLELTGTAEREVTVLIQTGDGTATGSPGKWLEVVPGVMCSSSSSCQ